MTKLLILIVLIFVCCVPTICFADIFLTEFRACIADCRESHSLEIHECKATADSIRKARKGMHTDGLDYQFKCNDGARDSYNACNQDCKQQLDEARERDRNERAEAAAERKKNSSPSSAQNAPKNENSAAATSSPPIQTLRSVPRDRPGTQKNGR